MKNISWVLIAFLLMAFTTERKTSEDQITVKAKITGCTGPLKLYRFDGFKFIEFQTAKFNAETAEFTIPKSDPQFYYIGQTESAVLPILLGPEEDVVISGNCSDMRQIQLSGSALNEQYIALKEQLNQLKTETSQLSRQYQSAGKNAARQQPIMEKLKALDDEKLALLDSLRKANPFFGRVAALNTYLSFQNFGQDYRDELNYFANEFFVHVDFSEAEYDQLPWVYEAFKSYATTLSSVTITPEMHQKILEKALNQIPLDRPVYQLAMSGIIGALKQKNHANFPYFANLYITNYGKKNPAVAATLRQEVDQIKNYAVGGIAPDFTQQNPEGEDLSLSDFRGKVVLVDFWASWCGPCRKENPNVLKMYNKYKDKGFEILGVSLDKTKDRWVNAIEQDGLPWPQISDLKGWSNAVAQDYGVRSIPHTILLDEEGKILARGLRGKALEQKLAEVLK
ncbi:MAG: hypothetical protein DHS20C18_12020 [Saprospiraceae bacterium]|nr:MAG: hypothetical protein DHS20C18_12020 [Saprospiraceae bacterium]